MKCTNCDKENDPQEKFCVECGQLLQDSAPAPTPALPSTGDEPELASTEGNLECPNCHKMNPISQAFCVDCGAKMSQEIVPPPITPQELKCPTCGTVNPPGAKFCFQDGTPLTAEPAQATPALAAEAKLMLPNGTEIALTEATMTLGRSDFERVVSSDALKFISRVQADKGKFQLRISFENGEFYVEDVDSANGTKLNGNDIRGKGKRELKDGDMIEVADVTTITFKTS